MINIGCGFGFYFKNAGRVYPEKKVGVDTKLNISKASKRKE
jgi:hypothetical protein